LQAKTLPYIPTDKSGGFTAEMIKCLDLLRVCIVCAALKSTVKCRLKNDSADRTPAAGRRTGGELCRENRLKPELNPKAFRKNTI